MASCDNNECIGGRAFQIKNKMFCSPECGNQFYGLTFGDDDYWEIDSESDGEECEEGVLWCNRCEKGIKTANLFGLCNCWIDEREEGFCECCKSYCCGKCNLLPGNKLFPWKV